MQYAALIKAHIQRYVNSGHDADTPLKFAQAISSGDGVPNVTVLIGYIVGKITKPEYHLKNIKKLHYFKFDDDGMEVRKMAGIGEGLFIDLKSEVEKLKKLNDTTKYIYEIVNSDQLENLLPKRNTILPLEKGGEVKIEEDCDFEDEEEGAKEEAD